MLYQLCELGCRHPGQVLSHTKMLGQLQDGGNTTTVAHGLALMTALAEVRPDEVLADPTAGGQLVESAVGGSLVNATAPNGGPRQPSRRRHRAGEVHGGRPR